MAPTTGTSTGTSTGTVTGILGQAFTGTMTYTELTLKQHHKPHRHGHHTAERRP